MRHPFLSVAGHPALRHLRVFMLATALVACSGPVEESPSVTTASAQLYREPCSDFGCYAFCGDGMCSLGEEDAWSCPDDCGGGGWCGNDMCDFNEDAWSCPGDCGYCGDAVCGSGETATSCPADCGGSTSGTVLGRFALYCGKVNNHQSPGGSWTPDPDCTSGCNIGGLAYCQKFFPGSTAIRQVPVSSKPNNVWTNAGCGPVVDDWDGNEEFECLSAGGSQQVDSILSSIDSAQLYYLWSTNDEAGLRAFFMPLAQQIAAHVQAKYGEDISAEIHDAPEMTVMLGLFIFGKENNIHLDATALSSRSGTYERYAAPFDCFMSAVGAFLGVGEIRGLYYDFMHGVSATTVVRSLKVMGRRVATVLSVAMAAYELGDCMGWW